MKQDIATYLSDSFVDFAGKEHKIVACALSQSPESDSHKLKVGWIDDNNVLDTNDCLDQEVYRMVTIGVAVCNPVDKFDEEAGKRIAYNKAANMDNLPRLYAPSKGLITKELVETFLNQQVKFLKENPELLIPGYKKSQSDYEAVEAAKKDIDNLNDEEKVIFDLATKGFDFSKYINLAKVYVKKIMKHE
jgi:hypothetical protein